MGGLVAYLTSVFGEWYLEIAWRWDDLNHRSLIWVLAYCILHACSTKLLL